MTLEELKIRQLSGQHLITSTDKRTAAKDLCGFQAQFFSNAVHGMRIRCNDFDETQLIHGFAKNWTLRGTLHVFAQEDLPLFLHRDNGKNYRSNVWTAPSFWNQRADWSLSPERQTYFSEIVLDASSDGPKDRESLKSICRSSGMTAGEENSMFHPWGGGIRELCERGFLNYVPMEKKVLCLAPLFTPIPEAQANLELAHRYFLNFGPATIHDAMYFFRATMTQVRKWLSQLPVVSCEFAGKTYYYIDKTLKFESKYPDCLFLSGFDSLLLGYEKKESLYLKPGNLRAVYNLSGIVMPTILLHGEIVGIWKTKNRNLTLEIFDFLSPIDKKYILDKVDSLWTDIRKVEWK